MKDDEPAKDETKLPAETHTHSFSAATCTEAKRCSCGTTEGEPLGHQWKNATCESAKTCSVCGATEGSAAGHSWKDATCTAAKVCTICSVTSGSALGHNYSSGSCTRCGKEDPDYEVEPQITYVLNVKSNKFHRLSCSRLPTDNREDTTKSRQEIIDMGYDPCGHCDP